MDDMSTSKSTCGKEEISFGLGHELILALQSLGITKAMMVSIIGRQRVSTEAVGAMRLSLLNAFGYEPDYMMSISALNLSARTLGILKRLGVEVVRDIYRIDFDELLSAYDGKSPPLHYELNIPLRDNGYNDLLTGDRANLC